MPTYEEYLDQANRNAELAKQLLAQKEKPHYDWVATISFYAAMHYIRKTFEENRPVVKLYDFEETVSGDIVALIKSRRLNKSPHSVQLEILRMNFKAVFILYASLRKMADNARYYCYDVSELEAARAVSLMNEIRKWSRDFKLN